jgi:signal transduction histidine kinase
MLPLDASLQFTISLPFVIFTAAVILVLLILSAVYYYRQRQEVQRLSRGNAALSKRPDDQPDPSNAVLDSYQNFLYNISHEVSNPLQSIQTNLDNMARCAPGEVGRREQYYQIITSDIKRLADLTQKLRLLSRLETPDRPIILEAVNVKGVIETVIMSQSDRAELKGVRIQYHGPDRLAKVSGNRDNLEQVILNLIDNSIKYAPDTGGEIMISAREDPDRVHIRVIDNGAGIPAEDLPYIFDTAYRAPDVNHLHRKGTGLGLAIAKRIIEQHGGTIQIQSRVGEGTTVLFDLPVYKPA